MAGDDQSKQEEVFAFIRERVNAGMRMPGTKTIMDMCDVSKPTAIKHKRAWEELHPGGTGDDAAEAEEVEEDDAGEPEARPAPKGAPPPGALQDAFPPAAVGEPKPKPTEEQVKAVKPRVVHLKANLP